MATIGYLRKSTDHQDFLSQKHGVLEYANSNGLANIAFVEDSVTGKKSPGRIGNWVKC